MQTLHSTTDVNYSHSIQSKRKKKENVILIEKIRSVHRDAVFIHSKSKPTLENQPSRVDKKQMVIRRRRNKVLVLPKELRKRGSHLPRKMLYT